MSDGTSRVSSSSIIHGGTYRWMSPELFYPENFGLKDSRPTRYSDCYALGMVVYEVLSGKVPFPRHHTCAVVAKIGRGERPGRPRGAEKKWFTDDVWTMLQRCWTAEREDRPKIEDVLRRLEDASTFWIPLSPQEIVDSSTTNSSARDPSDPNTEGSLVDSGVSSSPRAAPHELPSLERQFDELAKIPVRDSSKRGVEKAPETRDGLVDIPFESSSYPSSSDQDSPILPARSTSVPSHSNADFSPMMEIYEAEADTFTFSPTADFEQEQHTSSADKNPPSVSPLTFAKPLHYLHKYDTDSPSPVRYPTAPPKSADTPVPAASKQRGGRKLRPRIHTQPASPRQRIPLPRRRPVGSLFLLSTFVEPPSSSHEYDTDSSSSAVGPFVPQKRIRIPASTPSKQRGARKSPRTSLRWDYLQPTSPRQSDPSPQTTPGKSLTLLSTLVEPPSSSYGQNTSLQNTPANSLGLLSTLVEPSSSFYEYGTPPSSITSPLIPPMLADIQPGVTSNRRGGRESRPRGHTQSPSMQSPPLKSSTLPSAPVKPSFYEHDSDSSSSTIYPVVPPKPIVIPADRVTSKRRGREGLPWNHKAVPWRSHSLQRETTLGFLPPPSPKLQALSMDSLVDVVAYGDTRGLSTSQARRGRFGGRLTARPWKSWLRSSLGKLFGNSVTSPWPAASPCGAFILFSRQPCCRKTTAWTLAARTSMYTFI